MVKVFCHSHLKKKKNRCKSDLVSSVPNRDASADKKRCDIAESKDGETKVKKIRIYIILSNCRHAYVKWQH